MSIYFQNVFEFFDDEQRNGTLTITARTRVHSTDSYLVLELQTFDVSYTTDALLKKATDLTHSVDSYLKKALDASHNTDARLQKTIDAAHQVDALLKATYELGYTTDTYLVLRTELIHNTDTILTKLQDLIHAADAFLRSSVSAADLIHTIDCLLSQDVRVISGTATPIISPNIIDGPITAMIFKNTGAYPISVRFTSRLNNVITRIVEPNEIIKVLSVQSLGIISITVQAPMPTPFLMAISQYDIDDMLFHGEPTRYWFAQKPALTLFEPIDPDIDISPDQLERPPTTLPTYTNNPIVTMPPHTRLPTSPLPISKRGGIVRPSMPQSRRTTRSPIFKKRPPTTSPPHTKRPPIDLPPFNSP